MKYWLVTNEFPPNGGGIAPYALNTAEMFDAAGIETRVFFCDASAERATIQRLSKRVSLVRYHHTHLFTDAPIANPLGDAAWTSWNTAEFLEEAVQRWGKPSVIEFQDFGALGYFTLLKRWCLCPHFSGVKMVLTAHRPLLHALSTGGESTLRLPAFFVGEMERWTFRAADAVFYPSEFLLERLAQADMGFRPNTALVVRNPFEPTSGERLGELATRAPAPMRPPQAEQEMSEEVAGRFRTYAEGLGAWPLGWRRPVRRDAPPIGYFGKLQDQKGVRDILRLMDRWWTEGGRTPLHVFGKDSFSESLQGSMRAHLEGRYRDRMDQGLLHFNGGYNRTDMKTIAKDCRIAVLPYREECMPYAALEIINAGMTPLCSPGGGQQELIAPQWRSRLLYDPADYEDFCDKLQWVITLQPEQRSQLTEDLIVHVASIASYDVVLDAKLEAIKQTPAPDSRRLFPFVNDIPKAMNRRRDTRPSIAGRVSVIIPYFNMQEYVDDAIESVLATEYPDIEIIVVNDGSSSTEARQKLGELCSNQLYRNYVRVIEQLNGGLASARNAGAETATGEFLLFLDADDMIAPTFIERCLELLQAYPNVSYASSWLKQFGEGDGEWITWICDFPFLLYHSTQHCTVLIRRDDWLNHGVNDITMTQGMEDYESFIRLTAAGIRGVAIPAYLFLYRVRPQSMMKSFTPELQASLYRKIHSKHRDLFSRYADKLHGLIAENGHGAFAADPTRPTRAARELFDDRLNTHEHADKLLRAKKFIESAAAARGAMLKDPSDTAAAYLLGQALVRQGRDPVSALEAYSLAASRKDDPWARLMRASLLLEFGQRREGRRELKGLLAREPQTRGAVTWLAHEHLWRGAPVPAHGLAAASTEKPGDLAWATSQKALMCLGCINPSADFRANAHVWEGEQRATTRLALGMAALHAGDIEGGLDELDNIAIDEAGEAFLPQGAAHLARLLAQNGREASALALTGWTRKALRETDGASSYALASPDLDEFEALLREVIRLRANVREARSTRDHDALEMAKVNLFSVMSDHVEARCEAADDAFAVKDNETALEHLEAIRGASTSMMNPWYWVRRFRALATAGRHEEARSALQELLACDIDRLAGHEILEGINAVIASGELVQAHQYLRMIRPAYDRYEDVRLWWCSTAIDTGAVSPQINDDLLHLVASSTDPGRQVWARYHRARAAARLGKLDDVYSIIAELHEMGGQDALNAANSLSQTFKPIEDGRVRSVPRPK